MPPTPSLPSSSSSPLFASAAAASGLELSSAGSLIGIHCPAAAAPHSSSFYRSTAVPKFPTDWLSFSLTKCGFFLHLSNTTYVQCSTNLKYATYAHLARSIIPKCKHVRSPVDRVAIRTLLELDLGRGSEASGRDGGEKISGDN